jgi:hypothetical protein
MVCYGHDVGLEEKIAVLVANGGLQHGSVPHVVALQVARSGYLSLSSKQKLLFDVQVAPLLKKMRQSSLPLQADFAIVSS